VPWAGWRGEHQAPSGGSRCHPWQQPCVMDVWCSSRRCSLHPPPRCPAASQQPARREAAGQASLLAAGSFPWRPACHLCHSFDFFCWRGKDRGQEAELAIQTPASHLPLRSWQLRALLAGAEGFPSFYPLLAVSSLV